MNDNGRKQIDFKFSKNWKTFLSWYDAFVSKAKCAPRWEDQIEKIEECFDSTNPEVVDWKKLWKEFKVWFKEVHDEKGLVTWKEQQRQIETLMLTQLRELNSEQFVLVFLHKGKPEISMEKMDYWTALSLKEKLSGNSNGEGGNEDMDRITIVNLSRLIK